MAIEWIEVEKRVPDSRREVLTWGWIGICGMRMPGSRLLWGTKFNPSSTGGRFDVEIGSRFYSCRVTHWAEINGPQ